MSSERFCSWSCFVVQEIYSVDNQSHGHIFHVLHDSREKNHAFGVGHLRIRNRPSVARFEHSNDGQFVSDGAAFNPLESYHLE